MVFLGIRGEFTTHAIGNYLANPLFLTPADLEVVEGGFR